MTLIIYTCILHTALESERSDDLRRYAEASERRTIRVARKEIISGRDRSEVIAAAISAPASQSTIVVTSGSVTSSSTENPIESSGQSIEQVLHPELVEKSAEFSKTMKTEMILPMHANHMGVHFNVYVYYYYKSRPA